MADETANWMVACKNEFSGVHPMLRVCFPACITLLLVQAASSRAIAEDLKPSAPTINLDGFQKPAAALSEDEDASKLKDLDATRAALDRHSGPAISFGISGWVGEQVTIVHQGR